MVPVPVIKPWLVKPVFRLNVALPGMLMMPDDVLANGACTSIVPVSTLMVPWLLKKVMGCTPTDPALVQLMVPVAALVKLPVPVLT